MMTTRPETLYFNGKTYHLFEHTLEEPLAVKGWTCFFYAENDKTIPPEVTNGKSRYFLCTVDSERDNAYNDLLERINKMK